MEPSLRMAVVVAAFLVSLCVGGCASVPPSPESFGKLEVKESDDGSTITFASASAPGGGWSTQSWYRLRGSKDKATKAISHELYVYIWYNEGGFRNYVTATFAGDREVAVTKIHAYPSDIGRRFGAFDEWIAIPLDEAWLNSARSTGFDMRLKALSGHEVLLSVPGVYVMAYTKAVGTVP
jgi:hypothetical protein